jgi:cation:H+ antiporter
MTTALLLIIGLVFLVTGAEFLVRGGASLALRLNIKPLVVGLTVVAFGTSAPEMAVSVKAAVMGQGDVAVGNIVGSNIFNIAFILGLSALICPLAIHAKLIRYDIPLMIGVTIVAIVMLWDKSISRWEGILLFAGLLIYTYLTFKLSARDESAVQAEAAAEIPRLNGSIGADIAMVLGGLAGLVLGADWFVQGAIAVARYAGLSEAVIGLTIVAAGTSLPELATTVVAAVRRHADIAIGNVVGSNIFNILSILGITAIVKPFSMQNILVSDIFIMLFFAVLLLPLAATGLILKRWEGGVLFAGYILYVIYRLMN